MSDMISYCADFVTDVLLPFVVGFFSSNVGLFFVAVACISVVFIGLKSLMRTNY